MALKFRRGTTAQKSGSLAFGEPYVNTTLGTLQIGLDTGDVSLLINSASQGISGSSLDITGNAKIDGNLTLGGNITIGDQTSDTVTVTANLSSSLIPSVTNTFDLGSSTKIWRDLYLSTGSIKLVDGSGNLVNTITNANIVTTDKLSSGSITLTSSLPAGTVSGSSQIVGILTSLNAFSASENTKSETLRLYTASVDVKAETLRLYTSSIDTKFSTLATYTGSNDTTNTTQNTRLSRLEESTASLNAFSASQLTKDSTLQTYTASIDTKFSTLQTLTASVQSQISRIQESTASLNAFSASNDNTSLNSFTSSINTTIKNRLDVETVISGSSQVTLSATTGFTSYSSSVDSRILTEKGRVDAILLAADADKDSFAEIVTLINSVDTTNDNAFASFYTASVNRLNNLESTSASLAIETANLESFTSSINTTIKNKLNTDGVISGSSQVNFTQLSGISNGIVSGSSQVTPLLPTGTISGSTQLTSSYDGRYELQGRSVVSGSAQVVSILTSLNSFSASNGNTSLNSYTASNDTTNTTQNSRLDQLSTASGSAISRLNTLESETLNLEIYTASFATASVTLSNKTLVTPTIAAIGGDEGGQIDFGLAATNQTLTGSVSFDIWRDRFRIFEGGGTNRGVFLQISSASTSVGSEIIINNGTQTLTNKTISGASNTLSNIGNSSLTNSSITIAGQSTALGGTITTETIRTAIGTVVTGSSQVNFTQLSGISANIISGSTNSTNVNFTISGGSITANLIGGVVSGSSQITAGSTTNFATDVKTQLNSNTVVSGSSQVNFTQLSGISANIISASSDTSNVDMIISGGSISANLYGGVVSGSAQVVGMLASLNTYTGSNNTNISALQAETTALEAFTASAAGRLSNLESYSSSLRTAITVAGSDVTVNGNLTVSGTTTTINSTTVAIGDNIIQLNGTGATNGGIVVRDATAATTTSGSLLWDTTNDKWIAGPLGSEDDVVLRTLSQTLTNKTISGASNTLSNIANASLTNSSITIAGQSTALGSSVTAETIRTAIGTVVTGSAQIDLTATTNYATGILTRLNTVGVFSGSSQVTGIGNAQLTNSSVTIGTTAISLGASSTTLTGLTSVTSTGFTGALTGNASTATTLQTARTINGTSFNGSADITIPNLVSGSSQITAGSTTNFATDVKTQLNSNTVISGSSQVSHDSTTGYSANRHIDHTAVSISAGSGLTGGGDISTTRTLSIANLGVTDAMLAGSISNAKLTNSSITIAGQSTSLGGTVTAETIRTAIGTVVTGSSQISHDSTTGYSANRHVDHTAVSITAGSGLTGGGDISTTRTISVATGGVTNAMLAGSIANDKLTNSSITIAGQSTALGGSVTAETIRTAIGTVVTGSAQVFANVSGDITIASNGVATIAANSVALGTDTTGNYMVDVSAGSGISISHTAGEGSTATITNAGVRSIAAGTGISVSATTGDNCSISIGQSVATSATPTFAGLTINGAITATGDITAYYTSDKRHKNNIQIIPNALEKVSKLNGVTWEWNDDVNEVTKSTPKTGLIAQDVQEVLPEVVREREDGFLSLDYSKMVGLLVEAIKEQQSQIHNLTLQVENLKKQKGL